MKVNINNETISVPESWNGLSFQQAFGIYQIAMKDAGRLLAPDEIMPVKRIQMARYLLRLDEEFMRQWEADCIRSYGPDGSKVFAAELDELCKITDPLFDITEGENGDRQYAIKLEYTRAPFKHLQRANKAGKKKTYYAPADGLSNISLYELGTAFTIFENYLEHNNEELVDRLIATLYRPSKPRTADNKRSGYQGDRRLPLLHHEAMVTKRAKYMQELSKGVKQMILFWFASCRQQIVESHRDIFKSSADGKRDDFGWGGLILSLSGGLVHVDQVSQQPWQNGLTYIRYQERQRKDMEERMKRSA